MPLLFPSFPFISHRFPSFPSFPFLSLHFPLYFPLYFLAAPLISHHFPSFPFTSLHFVSFASSPLVSFHSLLLMSCHFPSFHLIFLHFPSFSVHFNSIHCPVVGPRLIFRRASNSIFSDCGFVGLIGWGWGGGGGGGGCCRSWGLHQRSLLVLAQMFLCEDARLALGLILVLRCAERLFALAAWSLKPWSVL